MKGIHLIVGTQDMGKIATSFRCYNEVTYEKILTTQDGTEHDYGMKLRPIVEFTIGLTPDTYRADFDALTAKPLMVTFDHPDLGTMTREMRLDCDLDKVFEILNCVDRWRYYSSGTIRLRSKEVL